MNRLASIVVASDFSRGSRAALAQAVRLARLDGAALHVVHAVRHDSADELRHLAPDAASVVDSYLRDQATDRLREELEALGVGDGSGAIEVSAAVGNPVEEIFAAVDRSRADLLVIGATGDNGRRLGTVAGRCVRKAKTHTLLVPADRTGPFERVVAGVDFSERSPVVLGEAVRAAGRDGGKVTAVHVYEVPWERARWGGGPGGDAVRLEQQMRALLDRRFEVLRPTGDPVGGEAGRGPEVRFELVRGIDYGRSLVAFATEHGADLVVTGTTGRTGLGYLLLGTTAEKVMRDTDCAVLAVK